MRHSKKIWFLFAAFLLPTLGYSNQIRVNSVRYLAEANQSKVVFEVTDSPKHRVFVLENPARLVIDINNAETKNALKQPSESHPLFSQARTSTKNDADLRVVVMLKQDVTAKSHKLTTSNPDRNHLVVNLLDKGVSLALGKSKKGADKKSDNTDPIRQAEKTSDRSSKSSKSRKHVVVAIDAGHGGDDPGAHGPNGTLEKQVTLAIAKKLYALINGQPGMKAKLVRKGDYYVGLRERMKIARQAGADLFISIHADAYDNPEVNGASVYTLSRTGASNEAARWLASSENAKEKVGGVNLDDKDEVLASVLMDLSQTATQQASISLANKVLKNFRNIGELHYDTVQNAGFVVLKSPDIPSILVETAYISNPKDELNLLSSRYQAKMADAIFKGILNYFEQLQPIESDRMAKL